MSEFDDGYEDDFEDEFDDGFDEELDLELQNRFLVFSVGENHFATKVLDTKEAIEKCEIKSLAKKSAIFDGVIRLRDEIIAILDLSKKLELEPSKTVERQVILIVGVSDKKIGVIVDAVVRVDAVEPENVSTAEHMKSFFECEFVAGIYRINGEIVSVIDFQKFIRNVTESKDAA